MIAWRAHAHPARLKGWRRRWWALPSAALQRALAYQQQLLDRIPAVPHLQAAWLLLLFCVRSRANVLLRALPPAETLAYAEGHDIAVAACLHRLSGRVGGAAGLGHLDLQERCAQLPLVQGGLGLRAAVRERFAAHWASWAGCLPVVRLRLPALGAELLARLNAQVKCSRSRRCAGAGRPPQTGANLPGALVGAALQARCVWA